MANRHRSSHQPPPVTDPMDRLRFPTDPWRLVETRHGAGDLGRTETLFAVGNGYLGMRGNPEEGRDSHTHGTFVNGFHEIWPIQHAEEAYGFARVGQTIVHVPDTNLIKLYADDEPIRLEIADLPEYERSIDFRDGVLRRRLRWQTPSGAVLAINSTRMVSMTDRHLAVMTMEIEVLEGQTALAISSQMLNRQDGRDEYYVRSAAMGEGFDPRKASGFDRRVLEPQWHGHEGARTLLGFRAAESRMTLGVGTDHEFSAPGAYEQNVWAEEDSSKVLYRLQAAKGDVIRLTKYASYHSSRGVPTRELIDRVHRTLDRAIAKGVSGLLADQQAWFAEYWDDVDVEVPGQPELQQAIRWNLFQLAQATGRADTEGISAKGVTGSGYSGHYFWDTEIYVMPFLTYTRPNAARSALRFRYNMLPAARARAAEMSQHGALFPWRTISGEEASAYYAAGTAQYHIDADISYALIRYVLMTGDADFLIREAVDILVETARMWADLGFWRSNGDEEFHIHGVTGPDEYTTVVNDNLFTNVMARYNLTKAAHSVFIMRDQYPEEYDAMAQRLQLREGEADEWLRCASCMAIPYDEEFGMHPQDSHFLERELWDLDATPVEKLPLMLNYHPLVIYRFQVLKQADVVLALFLQGDQFTLEEKKRNFDYYDPITTGDSSLSAVVQSIIAAEVGYHQLALRYFYGSLFVDLMDAHSNTSDGVHVASTGGVWSSLVSGFGGLRDYEGQLSFDPRLPAEWESLVFRFQALGTKVKATLTHDEYRFDVLAGTALDLWVRGQKVSLVAGATARVALDGQGPRIDGQPATLPARRRADGSLMTASVPTDDPWG